MNHQQFKFAQRVVIVMYPTTFEEFQEAVAAGYQVSTTPEQRVQWGLSPADQLPVLDPDQAIELLFAEPGDPILDTFDTEMSPPPWGPDGAMRKLVDEYQARQAKAGAPDGDTVEARIPNSVTLSVPRSIVEGGAGAASAAAPA